LLFRFPFSRKQVNLAKYKGQDVVVFKCEQCNALGAGTLIAAKGSPFVANIIGYCPPLLKKGSHEWSFDNVLERGTVVVAGMKDVPYSYQHPDESQGGSKVPQATLTELVSESLQIVGGVKVMHSLGRLLGDYSKHACYEKLGT
jgi:hypothetical protein